MIADPSYQRIALDTALAKFPPGSPIHTAYADPAVSAALTEHETTDAKALQLQASYRRWGRVGLIASLAAGVLGGLLLVPKEWLGGRGPLFAGFETMVGFLQAIALLLAFAAARWLLLRHSLKDWLTNRAQAEVARGAIFRALLDSPGAPGADAKLLATQKFSLTMDAHIRDQLAFYEGGCRRNSQLPLPVSVLRWLGYAFGAVAVAVVIASLPQSVAQICGWLGISVPGWLAQLKLPDAFEAWRPLQHVTGTMSASLFAFAGAWALLHQSERNLCLYTENKSKLESLVTREAAGSAAEAAAGRLDAAKAFLAQAHNIMEGEHAIWKKVHEVSEVLS